MKKFIAALIAVVMVVSCMSVAFAGSINVSNFEAQKASRVSVKINAEVKTGDKISFWVKPVGVEGGEADMYARNSAKAIYLDKDGNETGEEVYSGKHIADHALAEVDGWYYIECVAKSDATPGVYELSLDVNDGNDATDGEKVSPESLIAGVCVNGVEVGVVAWASATLTTTTMEEPVIPEDGGEEETEGVEDTGVVSVAVVAVAAVVGGAVVLTKREF